MDYLFNIYDYDYYLVMFSGGKDSTACLLHLLDLNIPIERIELWHHLVDGKDKHLMDWECTEDYCRKFASAFEIPIYYSWKNDGFEGEMLRENAPTKPNYFETPNGLFYSGGKGKTNTRLMFPQISDNLSVRWCSAYLKIDVARTAVVNQQRFKNKKVLIVSGERAEESPARKRYAFFEPDRTDNRNGKSNIRHVDRCRIVHHWKEKDVWGIISRYHIVVHPCYYLGYSRCSCKWCIFGSPDQAATSFYLSPAQGQILVDYERKFGKTTRPGIDLATFAKKGTIYNTVFLYSEIAAQAVKSEYKLPIFTDNWILPAGAYKNSNGPS